MYIARLTIAGYRGIRHGTIHLQPHSVLVGINNVGKTTIANALALLLGRERLVPTVSEYDFTGGAPDAASRIHIRAVVTGLRSERIEDAPEIFGMEEGAVPLWWDPKDLQLRASSVPGASLAFEIGYCARFDDEEMEARSVRYFVDGEVDPFTDGGRRLKKSLVQQLGLFVLPARRTWDSMLSFRSPLFKQLVVKRKAMPVQSVTGIRNTLRSPDERPELEDPFSGIIAGMNAELAGFLGAATADLRFRPTEGDTPAVLEALMPHLAGRNGIHIPMGRHGSGIVSLQTLLLLLQFGQDRAGSDQNFILVAEEPELHLHPGHHRRLVGRMHGVSDQTIITTHSPEVAGFHRLSEIVSLHCSDDGVVLAEPILRPGTQVPEANPFIRLFILHRADVCEALMSQVAVLPEGLSDFRWLRYLSKESVTAEGWSTSLKPEQDSVGVLPTHDAAVVTTYRFLSASVKHLLPLVDGGAAGSGYLAQLLREATAPQAVVQLADGRTIEDVIAWILSAEGLGASDLSTAAGRPIASEAELAEQLRDAKTRWDKYEEFAALIGTSQARALRARCFVSGLGAIGLRLPTRGTEFRHSSTLSSPETSVWRFDPWSAS